MRVNYSTKHAEGDGQKLGACKNIPDGAIVIYPHQNIAIRVGNEIHYMSIHGDVTVHKPSDWFILNQIPPKGTVITFTQD